MWCPESAARAQCPVLDTTRCRQNYKDEKNPRDNQFKTPEAERMKELDLAEKDEKEQTIQV